MSLPTVLQERLRKRGILAEIHKNKINYKDFRDEEPSQYETEPLKKRYESFWIQQMKQRMQNDEDLAGYECCPNKYNIFHSCTLYCLNRWGDGILQPDPKYIKAKSHLLQKYPLPENWEEVYDRGTGVHYYWHKEDDTVSWLPPLHPNAHISKSAQELRKELHEIEDAKLTATQYED